MNEDERELLISRAVDGSADGADWTRLERLAADDPAVWRDLAATLRTSTGLKAAIAALASGADRVFSGTPENACPRIRPWLGWAAALLLVALWAATSLHRGVPPGPTGTGDRVGLENLSTSNDPEFPVIDRDRFLGTLPTVVVGFRPGEGTGCPEVLLLRRFRERGTENDVRMLAEDEHGRPAAIPVGLAGFAFSESL